MRLRRFLYTLLGVSISVCAVTLLAWTTSFPAAGYLVDRPTNGGMRFQSAAGQFDLYYFFKPQTGLLPIVTDGAIEQPVAWTGYGRYVPLSFGQLSFYRGSYWRATTTTYHFSLHIHYGLIFVVNLGLATGALVWINCGNTAVKWNLLSSDEIVV